VRHGSCMCDCDMAKSWFLRTCWILSAWVCSFIFDMTPWFGTWLICLRRGSFVYDMSGPDVRHDCHVWCLTRPHGWAHACWILSTWVCWFVRHTTHSCVSGLMYIWHGSFVCAMTGSCVRHGPWILSTRSCSFIYMTFRIDMWHDSYKWDMVFFLRDMTRSYVKWMIRMWHDSFVCAMTHSYVTWLVHTGYDSFMCDMTRPCVKLRIRMRNETLKCDMTHLYVTWLVYMRHDAFIFDMTRSYVTCLVQMWHDSFACDTTRSYVTWLTCDVTHTWRGSSICNMTNRHARESRGSAAAQGQI